VYAVVYTAADYEEAAMNKTVTQGTSMDGSTTVSVFSWQKSARMWAKDDRTAQEVAHTVQCRAVDTKFANFPTLTSAARGEKRPPLAAEKLTFPMSAISC